MGNIFIGEGAGSDSNQDPTADNSVVIGDNAYATASNQVALGDEAVSELRMFGGSLARDVGVANLILGKLAGNFTMTGGANVIAGHSAGATSTTDERAVIIGYQACSNAFANRAWIAIGDKAGAWARDTIDCTAVGSMAGWQLGNYIPVLFDVVKDQWRIEAAGADLTHGLPLPPHIVGATFFGKNAGRYNTIGRNNTGIGDSALGFTTVGDQNTAVGYTSGESNVSGFYNCYFGNGCSVWTYNGDENSLYGYSARGGVGGPGAGGPTDPVDVQPGGSRLAGLGAFAFYEYTGDDAAGVGHRVFANMVTSVGGFDAGLGGNAGRSVVTGGGNTFVGGNSGHHASQAADVQNSIAMGANSYTTADNQVVIGDSGIVHTVLRGAVGIGLGLDTPSAALHVLADATAATPLLDRAEDTDDMHIAARLRSSKATGMGDGFGTAIGLYVRDDAATDNELGVIGATRNGADDSGEIRLRPSIGGTLADGLALRAGQAHLDWNTPIPAGGTDGVGLAFSSTADFGIFFGAGLPTLSAARGSLYLRSDGSGTNDRAYINIDGGTGWTALLTAA